MAMQAKVNGKYVPVPPRAVQSAFDGWETPDATAGVFDMEPINAELLADAVIGWVNEGWAITIGRTSDGGALGIHLLARGDKRSTYHATIEEAESRLHDIVARVRRQKP